jgi:predicted AAA+ superfamily ATPase
MLASGSSALEIRESAYHLSGREMVFPVNVLSFRELIGLCGVQRFAFNIRFTGAYLYSCLLHARQ